MKKSRRKRYSACDDVERLMGVSRGLKNSPPDCFLRAAARRRSSPPTSANQTKTTPSGDDGVVLLWSG